MAVTSVNLSRSTASVIPGGLVELVALALDNGVPVASQSATASSSDTAKALAHPVAAYSIVTQGTLSELTYTTPNEKSPLGSSVRKYTETTATGAHYLSYGVGPSVSVGDIAIMVAEVRATNRPAIAAQIYHVTLGQSVVSASVYVDDGQVAVGSASYGTCVARAEPIGDGWWRLTMEYTVGTGGAGTLSYLWGLGNTETAGLTSHAGSTSAFLEIGESTVYVTSGAQTDANGKIPILVRGVATGTSNVTATISSVQSSATAVTVENPTVTLSRATESVAVGDAEDLIVTAKLGDGTPVVGRVAAVASGDTSKARAFAGFAKLPARTGGWGITASYPGGTSPSGTPITRITEDTSSAPHEGEWVPVTNFPANSTVVSVVEVKDTAGRGFIHVGFSDGVTVGGVIITTSTGALTNYGGTGTFLYGALNLGGGWWQVWVAWTKSTTNAPLIVVGPSQSTTYSGSWTGNASYHIDVGLVSMLEPSATNTSGQSTIRLFGVAAGTSNVNATVSGITSSNTVVTTITASSLVLAIDEPASVRDDYIKASAPGAVAEFDGDPIPQPATGSDIVIEYDAGNSNSQIRVEIVDPRVY